MLREDPKSFLTELLQLKSQFQGLVLYVPGEIPLRTNEGVKAV